jgi:hypothetical protein
METEGSIAHARNTRRLSDAILVSDDALVVRNVPDTYVSHLFLALGGFDDAGMERVHLGMLVQSVFQLRAEAVPSGADCLPPAHPEHEYADNERGGFHSKEATARASLLHLSERTDSVSRAEARAATAQRVEPAGVPVAVEDGDEAWP